MSLLTTVRRVAPHDVARTLVRLREPGRYAKLMALRDAPVATEDSVTLKPLLERKAIFIHIPKCAGLAVSKSIFGCRGGAHMKVSDFRVAFSQQEYASFLKFAFVRNPWDRLVSAFYFLRDRGEIAAGRDMAGRRFDSFPDFRSFVRDYVAVADLQDHVVIRPQHQFLCRSATAPPEADFIGRFERLDQDFASLCARLGIGTGLMRTNAGTSRTRDYRTEYDDETAGIVARAYDRDIALFGYRFG